MKLQELKSYFAVLGIVAASFTATAQAPMKFIDPANMDLSVKPGDDFYQYASGTWIKNNPVPAKETRWGSFNVLREFNIQAVKGLVKMLLLTNLLLPVSRNDVLATFTQLRWIALPLKN